MILAHTESFFPDRKKQTSRNVMLKVRKLQKSFFFFFLLSLWDSTGKKKMTLNLLNSISPDVCPFSAVQYPYGRLS